MRNDNERYLFPKTITSTHQFNEALSRFQSRRSQGFIPFTETYRAGVILAGALYPHSDQLSNRTLQELKGLATSWQSSPTGSDRDNSKNALLNELKARGVTDSYLALSESVDGQQNPRIFQELIFPSTLALVSRRLQAPHLHEQVVTIAREQYTEANILQGEDATEIVRRLRTSTDAHFIIERAIQTQTDRALRKITDHIDAQFPTREVRGNQLIRSLRTTT